MKLPFPLVNKFLLPLRVKPAFLIIGAQKSGTNALHYYLSQHPDLIPANVKEIDFFSGDSRYADGRNKYHQNFPLRGVHFRLGYETSPSYLHNPNAAQRIFQYNSNLKLIAVLRDPVQRAFSAWRMYVRYFSEDRDWYIKWMVSRNGPGWNNDEISLRTPAAIADFGAYVEQELEAISSGKVVEAPVLSHGFYYQQVERFTTLFGRNRLFLLTSAELRAETIRILSEIEKFLNVSAHDWDRADLRPMFVGDSSEVGVSERTKRLLTECYREDVGLLQKKYSLTFGSAGLSSDGEH